MLSMTFNKKGEPVYKLHKSTVTKLRDIAKMLRGAPTLHVQSQSISTVLDDLADQHTSDDLPLFDGKEDQEEKLESAPTA